MGAPENRIAVPWEPVLTPRGLDLYAPVLGPVVAAPPAILRHPLPRGQPPARLARILATARRHSARIVTADPAFEGLPEATLIR